MGCCDSRRTDPIGLEMVLKGEAELFGKTQVQEDGFFDITLESHSQKSLTQSEVHSPVASFSFLAPGHTYFAEKVLQLASKDSSFLDRSALASTREESGLSLPTGRLATGHIRFISADAYFAQTRMHSTVDSALSLAVLLRENYPCKGDNSLVALAGSFLDSGSEELNLSLGDEEVRGREDPRMWQ